MEIEYWKVDPELQKEAEENYRTQFAIKLKDESAPKIIHELTFDAEAPDITFNKINKLFNFIERSIIKRRIKGIGVEVGAGPGTFSAILAQRSGVQRMYAIEICKNIVDLLAAKVISFLLPKDDHKVVAVAGSFDEMRLVDDSVDFIFDFLSLHHSLDLNVTLKECYRVLKPGGFVLCFDKARPSHYSEEDLNELLDTVYGPDYYAHYSLPTNSRLTRRLNGEREYRLKDWQSAFSGAGFSKFEHYYLAKPLGGNLASRTVKKIVSHLPVGLRLYLNRYLPKPRFSHKFIVSSENRILTPLVNSFAKEISLLIAYK